MTTTSATHLPVDSTPSRSPLLAALGLAGTAVFTAVGSFADLTNNGSDDHDMAEWLRVLGINAVATAILFGLVVRTAARGNAGRRSLITALFGVLSIAAFWSGLPSVIAATAVACALVDRDQRGAFSGMAKAGLVLSGFVVAAAAVLAVIG